MQNLELPPACWMHKNRSQKHDKNLFSSLRSSKDFNRRWIAVANDTIVYGERPDRPEKRIPLQTISSVKALPAAAMKSQGAPGAFAEFGWSLVTEAKEMVWVAEGAENRDAWVNYLTQALEIMQGKHLGDGGAAEGGAPTFQAMLEQSRSNFESSGSPRSPKRGAEGEDEDEDENELGEGKTQKELQNLVTGEDDDLDFDEDEFLDEEDEEDYSDYDDDDENDDTSSQRSGSGRGGRRSVFNKEAVYQNFLLTRSEQPYQHIAYKHDTYKDHFKAGDGLQNIRFSRTIDKLGRKDNVQVRDVFITNRYLYLCHKAMLGKMSIRAIELDQLVGVIESTVDQSLFAIIIPNFHDILFRVTEQKSIIPGTPLDVKHQMIAHLFAGQKKLVQDRPFIFREAPDVRTLIRRSEDDSHLPLATKGNYPDTLRVANNPSIYPALRTNADSIVYFSCMALRVNAKREQQLRAVALTDSALYVCNDSVSKISRRIPLAQIRRILYDSDFNGVLIKCDETDLMVTIKSEVDFKNLRSAVQSVCKESIGYDLKCSPSHQLYSVAQLVDQKTIAQHFGNVAGGTEAGVKAGWMLTRRLMRNAARMTAKGMTTMASGMADAGLKSIDVMKTGANVVGGVVVDNAGVGTLVDLMGAAGGKLMGQQKLLFETFLELDDEEAICNGEDIKGDTLHLEGAPNAANWKLGTVYYSSRCQKFNLQSHLDAEKTSDRLLIVCERGLYMFEDPNAGKGLSLNIFKSSKNLHLDEIVDFHVIAGFVRCERETNVVAIQTSEGKSSDIMLRIPNMILTDKLVRQLARQYCAHMSKDKGYHVTLPMYKSAKPDSLRAALRKMALDAAPTVALRAHPLSDQLGLSIIPDLCESLRRHGDNKIFFSGMAWRFRGKNIEGATGGPLTSEEKKNYKSFVFLISNCALYMLTKGGYEITRRTELRCIQKAYLSSQDPEAVLLQVPSEFDIYCRVEGRARELIDRIQEARADWTDYGLYLSGEEPGSHDIAEYTFPVETVSDIIAPANLEKPKGFDDLQSHREAGQIRVAYIKQIARTIEGAISLSVDAPQFKVNKGSDEGSDARSVYTTMTEQDTWEAEIKRNEDRIATINHSLHRAFRLGYRAATVRVMTFALAEVDEFKRKKQYAALLKNALDEENVAKYDEIWTQCRKLKGMDLFQRGQRDKLISLRERQHIERKIVQCIDCPTRDEPLSPFIRKKPAVAPATVGVSSSTPPPPSAPPEDDEDMDLNFDEEDTDEKGTPPRRGQFQDHDKVVDETTTMEERLSCLADLFTSAERAGVKTETLQLYRLRLDRRLQQLRMMRYLEHLRTDKEEANKVGLKTYDLLKEASESVGLNSDRLAEAFAVPQNPMVSWATKVIEAAADSGNQKAIEDAISRVSESEVANDPQVQKVVAAGKEDIATLNNLQPLVDELTSLCSQLRFALNRLDKEDLDRSIDDLTRIANATATARCLRNRHAMANMYLKRVKDVLAARDLHATREAKARQERLEYQERLDQAELDQQRLIREAEEEEERQQRHRRNEQLLLWRDKATRNRLQLDQYLRSSDVLSAKLTATNSVGLARELREIHEHYPEKDKAHFSSNVQEIIDSLQETARRASKFVETKSGEATETSVEGTNVASRTEEEQYVLPDELQDAIQHQDKLKIIAYVQAHQGQLSMKAIERIRQSWREASTEGQWISKLHSNIHTAVALGSIEMLQQHLETAKAHRSYSDPVVRDGTILLERMKKEAQERREQEEEEELNKTGGGKTPAADDLVLIPQPTTPEPLPEASSPGTQGQALQEIYIATCALLDEREGAAAGKRDPTRVMLPADSRVVRSYVDAWIKVLMHRVKPVGVFKKTDRTFQDVLQIVCNACVKGVKTAPETARLASHFESVKKYNNPKGLSSSQMFFQYALKHKHLESIVQEWGFFTHKDQELLFLEDSIHRHPDVFNAPLVRLLQCVTTQMEWSFEFVEPEDMASTGSPGGGSTGAMLDSPMGRASTGTSQTGGPSPPQSASPSFSTNRGQDNPIPQLRRSVAAITEYFRRESAKLGQRYSPVELQNFFDESKNKYVGVLVRENVCVALNHIFLSGFKMTGLFGMKNHPWEFLLASSEKLKMSARGLGGVGVPDAVEMVLSLTDPNASGGGRRGGVDIAKLSHDQLYDIRMRMFLCHALNQQTLSTFLESIFDSPTEPHILKFYPQSTKNSMFIDSHRVEILRVIRKLSSLPFSLTVDAEIW